ncbi:hypothetical protein J6Q66_08700 [bacterium]|nr:hypothetical protein [bacterium]
MKKFLLIPLILSLILLCGFKRIEKPFIILSSGTIDTISTERVERYFNINQRINYVLVIPDKLKYSGVRMQLSKQSDKTANWGFTIEETNDIYITPGEKAYRSYFVPRSKGHYIIQFFYLNKKNYPFAHKEFMVQ